MYIIKIQTSVVFMKEENIENISNMRQFSSLFLSESCKVLADPKTDKASWSSLLNISDLKEIKIK